MARHILPFALFLTLVATSANAAKRTIYADLQASAPLNTNQDKDAPRVYPVLLYTDPSLFGSKFAGRFLITGLYNSARFSFDAKHQQNGRWNVFYEVRTTLIYAGDAPVIDGQSVNTQNFSANMWGNNAGVQYLFSLFKFDWRTGFRFDVDSYYPYGDTDPTQFIRPDNYVEQGPTLFFEARDIPPMDLMLFGVYPLAKIEERFRHGLNAWGPVGATTNVDNYFRPSALVPFGIPVSRRLVITGRGFGAYVSEVDRMNAIKFGSMMQLGNSTTSLPGPGMYANEVYAQWLYGGTLGLRIIADREAKSLFAILPFVHAAKYSELLTNNSLRANGVGGVGIHLMGRIKKKFFWDAGYANVFGLQRSSDPAHELYVHLLWVPWEREVETQETQTP
jgi:hypothetical protein